MCRAAAVQAAKEGIETEIIDLRTVVPWDSKAVLNSVIKTGRLLVVHEDSKTCGFGAEVISEIVSEAFEQLRAVPARVTKSDDHNPFNYALELALLPSVDGVLKAMREQARQDLRPGRKAIDSGGGIGISSATTQMQLTQRDAGVFAQPAATVAAPQTAVSQQIEILTPRQSPTDEDASVIRFIAKVGREGESRRAARGNGSEQRFIRRRSAARRHGHKILRKRKRSRARGNATDSAGRLGWKCSGPCQFTKTVRQDRVRLF